MLPTKAIRKQVADLLIADATTLAPVSDANKIALINAPFTQTELLAISDLSFATFTGSTPIAGAAGSQEDGYDPATGEVVITIKAPAGGYRWACTAAPASPETIYGYALTDNGGTNLIATALLPVAEQISEVGDYIDIGAAEIRFVLQPMS